MSIDRWRVPKGPATHVLMDGGILSVPPEETNQFHKAYIEVIGTGKKLYVVEQKTDKFRFFVDLDYKAPEKLADADLIQFCSIIHEVVGTGRCLIAKAQPRPVKEGIKSGVHIHWPDTAVTRIEALNLRSKIISSLGEGPWDRVIDASVYGGSGLRMLWSHKKPTGDPYIPWRALGSSEDFSKVPDANTLALFAVRIEGGDADTTAGPVLDHSSFEEFVHRCFRNQERTRIKRIQRHDHDGWYAQTDSHWCENIRREHKSNHIWFSIRSGRVSQRCFDEECREFQGPEHILPPSIVEQLNDVAVVGSPSNSFVLDFLPDGPGRSVQEVRRAGPSLFGPGPRELETVFGKSQHVRTVGFRVEP